MFCKVFVFFVSSFVISVETDIVCSSQFLVAIFLVTDDVFSSVATVVSISLVVMNMPSVVLDVITSFTFSVPGSL
jgi:hypothetical protein